MLNPQYSINLHWDSRDEGYIATCPSFPSLSAFGKTMEEAVREAQVVLDMYIEEYHEEGIPLPEPQIASKAFSGQVKIRMPKGMHADLSKRAEAEGVSLNTLMLTFLAHGLGTSEAVDALRDLKYSIVSAMRSWVSQSGEVLRSAVRYLPSQRYTEKFTAEDEEPQDETLRRIYRENRDTASASF